MHASPSFQAHIGYRDIRNAGTIHYTCIPEPVAASFQKPPYPKLLVMLTRTISTFTILGFLADCAIIPSNDTRLFNPHTTSSNIINEIQIQCRGRQYGTNLVYSSCLDAFFTFTKRNSLLPLKIGTRNTGTYDRNLPWKWVSGEHILPDY